MENLKRVSGTKIYLILLIIISLIAIRQLFLPGYFESHDGIIHVMRLAHFDEALMSGQFPVRWLSTWMGGYGSPVFIFNWSLSYYLASFLHFLGLSFQSSIEVLFGLGFILSGLFFFQFIKEVFKDNLVAFVGAVLYIWAPYQFTDIYIRGALGESMSFFFLPLLLFLAEKFFKSKDKIILLYLSFGFAFFVLTHNLMAIIGFAIFIIYILSRTFTVKNLSAIKYLFLSAVFGLGITSFFWLPAFLETKYINYSNVYSSVDNQFIPILSIIKSEWRYAYSFPNNLKFSMSFQVGLMQIAATLAGLIIFVIKAKTIKHNSILTFNFIFFIFMVVISIFLSTNYARKIYELVPTLSIIGFPWRLLTIVTFSLAITSAIFVYLTGRLKVIVSLVIIITVIFLYWPYTRIVSWEFSATDFQYRNMIKTNTGFLPDTEFLPKESLYHQLLEDRGPASLYSFFEGKTAGTAISDIQNKSLSHTVNISTLEPVEIRANTFYFPGWKLYVDNRESPINQDQYGLIKFTVNTGIHDIKLIFKNTPVRTLANTISVASLILLMVLLVKGAWQKSRLLKFKNAQ